MKKKYHPPTPYTEAIRHILLWMHKNERDVAIMKIHHPSTLYTEAIRRTLIVDVQKKKEM